MNNYEMLLMCLEKYKISDLSNILYVDKNTINRWILLKKVPKYYHFDLCNLSGVDVDYNNFTFIEKDQFFTPPETVDYCLNVLKNKLKELNIDDSDFTYIEPSCGSGSFYNKISNKKIGVDIEPRFDGVIKGNYLYWEPINKDIKYITIGNPPFGLRGNLALRFINHSASFSDFVAFILPPLFHSDGKGACMNRVKGLNLIHSEKLNTDFHYPDGSKININVIFQIWSKNIKSIIDIKESCSDYVKIYSLSDGGTPSTTRNKEMQDKCDVYLASSSFEESKMKTYSSFEELPNRRGYGIKILKDRENIFRIINSID